MKKIEFNPIGVLLCYGGMLLIFASVFSLLAKALASIDSFSMDALFDIESTALLMRTKTPFIIIQTIGSFGVFFLPVWLTLNIFKGYSFKKSIFTVPPKPILILIAGSLIFIGMLATSGWLNEINSLIPLSDYWSEKEAQTQALQKLLIQGDGIGSLMISLVVIALMPAILEEFVFRGLALTLFNQILRNKHVAIILQGVLFGLIHWNMGLMLPITAIGILFGYIAYETKCIWYSVLIHFLNNALAVIALFYANKTDWAKSLDTDAGLPNWQYVVGTGILAIGVYIFFKLNKNSTQQNLTYE